MKLYLVFLCVAFVFVHAKEDSSSSKGIVFSELRKFVASKNPEQFNHALDFYKKTKTECPNIDDDLATAAKKAMDCFENFELGSDTVCSAIKKSFPKCTKPLIELMTNCFDDEYKFSLHLGIRTITGVIDQACNSTVEEVLELFNPCIFDKKLGEIEGCEILKAKRNDDHMIPKAELCDFRPKGKECLKQLTQSCKNPMTKRTFMEFYDVTDDILVDECNGV